MTREYPVLKEAIANLREAAQRIRGMQNLMRSQGHETQGENYRELAMAEAA